MKYTKKIPLQQEDIHLIIQSFQDGEFNYRELIKDNPTTTHNGQGAAIWNHIFTQLELNFKRSDFQVGTIKRGLWEVLYVYDESSEYLYTFMRYKNFTNLQTKDPENRLFHYSNVLSKINGKLQGLYEPEYEQTCCFGLKSTIDDENDEKLTQLLDLMVNKIDGNINLYALVLVSQDKGKVTDIQCKIPIENLNTLYTESWNDYIDAEYETEDYNIEETALVETDIILFNKNDNINLQHHDRKQKKKDKI